MSKIYIFRDKNRLTFTHNPFPEEPGTEPRLSRRTYLAFARWLRENVLEEDLKSEIVPHGMFNRHDLRNDRVRALRLIKATKPEDLYRTLGLYKKQASSCCIPRWAQDSLFEIPLYYTEDFYQLLRLHGLGEEDAAMFTELAESGSYKGWCRCHPRKEQLAPVSEDLHTAAKTLDGLPSRNWIRRLFKHEYPAFREEFDRKADKNPDTNPHQNPDRKDSQ